MSDEKAIRDTIDAWLKATKEGDAAALARMLDDEALFVVMGREPFGKKDFLAGGHLAPFRFESKVDVREVAVNGNWALTHLMLELEIVSSKDSAPMKLSGPTMSVWRKQPDGRWAIWRDANMVAPVH